MPGLCGTYTPLVAVVGNVVADAAGANVAVLSLPKSTECASSSRPLLISQRGDSLKKLHDGRLIND